MVGAKLDMHIVKFAVGNSALIPASPLQATGQWYAWQKPITQWKGRLYQGSVVKGLVVGDLVVMTR